RAATGQGNALVSNVGTQFRRSLLQTSLHRGDDLIEWIGEGFENFVGGNREAARHPFRQVATLDLQLFNFRTGESRADFLLDEFGRGFADKHAVVATDVIDDGFVELVPADSYRAFVNHAAQRDDRDFRRTTADIYNHRAAGVRYCKPRTDSCRHVFFSPISLSGTCAHYGLTASTYLYFFRAAGHAVDHARASLYYAARTQQADYLLEQFLGYVEVVSCSGHHVKDFINIAWHSA